MSRKTKRPKVVMFSTVRPATHVCMFHKEARSLARAGCDVVVMASHRRAEVVDGVHIKPLRAPSSRFRRILFSTTILPRMLREHADIYHFHDPELIFSGLLLRLLGKEAIYESHEDFPKDILGKPYLPRWARPIISGLARLFESAVAPFLSAVIVPSEECSPHIASKVILHNYPPLEYIPSDAKSKRRQAPISPFVVHCGTITRMRGAREMLESVAMVAGRTHIRLRLLGPVEDEGLRSEILSYEKRGLVEYLGEVPHRDVFEHCSGATAGLLLYHPAPMHDVLCPLKLFELMACEVPAIAPDSPLFRKLVRDQGCGLVVDPLNVPQIADAIIYLLEHPREAEGMGRRGRKLAEEKYNWESESKKLLLLYERLLGKRA